MGITAITVMTIQSRGKDVKCAAGGPDKETGKYAGWISLYRNGEYDHDLLSTGPVYDTKKDAIKAMKKVVEEIRAVDLSKIMSEDQSNNDQSKFQAILE